MMKKLLILGLLAAFVVASVGAVGLAYAQTEPEEEVEAYQCPLGGQGGGRMMGLQNGIARGVMGRWGSQAQGTAGCITGTPGVMHEYQVEALAGALGSTPETLNERLANGDTIWTIAQEKGLTQEQFRELMTNAHAEALSLAVQAGVLSQEQADAMQQRLQQGQTQGKGNGGAGCHSGERGFGARGSRGNR
jgi:hypothetical protein